MVRVGQLPEELVVDLPDRAAPRGDLSAGGGNVPRKKEGPGVVQTDLVPQLVGKLVEVVDQPRGQEPGDQAEPASTDLALDHAGRSVEEPERGEESGEVLGSGL